MREIVRKFHYYHDQGNEFDYELANKLYPLMERYAARVKYLATDGNDPHPHAYFLLIEDR